MECTTLHQEAPATVCKPRAERIPKHAPKSGKRGITNTSPRVVASCLIRYATFLQDLKDKSFSLIEGGTVFDTSTFALAFAIATKIVKNGNTAKRAKTKGTNLDQLEMSMRVITWLSYKVVQGYDDEWYDASDDLNLAYKCLFENQKKDSIAQIRGLEHAILQDLDHRVDLLRDEESTLAELDRIEKLAVGSEVGSGDGSFFAQPSVNDVIGEDSWSDADDGY